MIPASVRIRLLSAAAFGSAAALYGLGVFALWGEISGVGWALLGFAVAGGILGGLAGPRFAAARNASGAIALSTLVTLGAALLFVGGLGTLGLFSGSGADVAAVPLAVAFAVLGGIPALPFGALAGWAVWRWERAA